MIKQFCLGGAVVMSCALLADVAQAQCGKASWYGAKGLVAAHRTAPIGSHLKVTNKKTGQTVVVRITNRGPFVRSRVIDVSRQAAKDLGFIRSGIATVCVAKS